MNDFLLMKDSSEGDKGKEAMLDFVLSWTLRVASDAYPDKEVKQTLHKACRRILFKLIFGLKRYEEIERKQCQVCSVQVWKQWNNIDLHANVTLRIDGGEPEYHVIVVENKVYTPLSDNQLGPYKEIILNTYKGGAYEKHIHFWVITGFNEECRKDKFDKIKKECEANGWDCIPILDLQPNNIPEKEKPDSDIFDEFWLKEW